MKPQSCASAGKPGKGRASQPGKTSSSKTIARTTTPASAVRPRSWLFSNWLPGLLLLIATVLAYQPVWNAGFIWDDDAYITQNPLITASDGLKRIWFSQDSPSQYFPLVYTSFRVEHALWGFNAAGYHWLNLLLHGINAWLLWRILSRLRIPGAWFAAALFCLHPVQVETVAWATERKNILSLFFCLLALRGWIEFAGEDRPKQWRWYVLAIVFYVLALLSKTTACTLPAAMLLVLWLNHRKLSWARWIQLLPFVVIGLGMGLLTMWWERYHVGTHGGVFSLGMRERVLIASHAVWFYLGKLVLPLNLAFSYPRWELQPQNPLAYGWLAAFVALIAAVIYIRRWLGRGPEVALAFFVATLSPTLGFIMLFTFRYSFVADHYQYAACIGPLTLLAAGVVAWRKWIPPKLRQESPPISSSEPVSDVGQISSGPTLILIAVLCCLGVLTWRQSRIYQNVETLWRDTLAKNPTSWLAMSNLGRDLMHRGYYDEAMEQYKAALALNPKDIDSLVSMGNGYFNKGNYDVAADYYHRALEVNPDNPEAHINLAVILANRGQLDEAVEHDRRALVANPNHITAQGNLAVLLMRQGKYAEALEHYQKVLEMNPQQPLAHVNLALALNAMGHTNEARAHILQAADLVNEHAKKLAQENRLEEATSQYRETIRMLPTNADSHTGLGLVLERQGRLDEARQEFKEALRLDPAQSIAQQELRKLGGL